MAKRGENIRKRKDGRWEGRYIKGRKADRTAIWGYIYGHSYNEVKEKLTIKKMEVQQFTLNVDNPTFSELSRTWESSIFLGVKSSTAAHYHYTLQHYILPVLGPYRVQALSECILENSGNYCSCRPKPQDPRQRNGQGVPDACSENLPLCGTFTYYASN